MSTGGRHKDNSAFPFGIAASRSRAAANVAALASRRLDFRRTNAERSGWGGAARASHRRRPHAAGRASLVVDSWRGGTLEGTTANHLGLRLPWMPPYGTSYQSPAPIGLGPQPPAPNVGGLILVSRRGLVFVSGTVKRHDDGDIALALKTPWSDGTSHVSLSELATERSGVGESPSKARDRTARGEARRFGAHAQRQSGHVLGRAGPRGEVAVLGRSSA